MSSVDERIVEMRFDNAQFESGAKTSIGTLGKLQSALKLGDAGKSLSNIGTSVKSIDTGGLASGLEIISNRFSTLGIIGDQVIRRLTDGFMQLSHSAISAVKGLTIDQIGAGFTKYASKTEAVQTIMNATGQSIDEVNTVLDKLNWYTDETSYSFMDMVSSIAKFTGAGQDLAQTEVAMEGIANWAATAGVGPEKAASAFYNLSQAISTGSLRMQDWKSLQNLNMSTKKFKETAIQTAIELGKLKDAGDGVGKTTRGMDVDFKSFDSTLSTGWLDTEVLMATLTKFADRTTEFGLAAFHAAQEAKTFKDAIDATKDAVSTSWMNTWELIFGNYEEAKVLWTNVANEMIEFFTRGAEARNDMLQEWHDTGGYTAALEALSDAWQGVKNIADVVGDVFDDVFPPMTADRLKNITNNVRDLASRFKDFTSSKTLGEFNDELMQAHRGLLGLTEDEKAKRVFKNDYFKNLVDGFKGLLSAVSLAGKGVKAFFSALSPSAGVLKSFSASAVNAFGKLGRYITQLNESGDITERFSKMSLKLTDIQNGLINTISKLSNKFSNLSPSIKNAGNAIKAFIKDGLTKLGIGFKNVFDALDFEKAISLLTLGGGIFGALKLSKLVDSITGLFKGFDKIKESISDTLGSIGDALNTFTFNVSAASIQKIGTAIAILAAALLMLSAIKVDSLFTGLLGMAGIFAELVLALYVMSGFLTNNAVAKNIRKVSASFLSIAASILVMAAALKVISGIDPSSLTSAVGAVTILVAVITAAGIAMSRFAKDSIKGTAGLIAMAAAVLVLSSAVKNLGSLDMASLGKGLLGTIALLGALTLAGVAMSKHSKGMVASGIGMIGMAAAIIILSEAVKKLGALDLASLGKGLGSIGILLAEFALFNNFGGSAGKMLAGAASLLVMSAAIAALSVSIKALGSMELGSLAIGVGSIAAVLLALTVALNAMNGAIGGAAAMIIAAGAIMIFTPAVMALAQLNIGQVGVALLALAGAFAVIGAAGYLLAPVVVPILALSAALLMISASIAVAGAGLTLLGAGLATFAGSIAVSVGAILAAVAALITGLGNIATSLVGSIASIIGAIAMGLASAVPQVANAALALILGIVNALAQNIPQIASAGIQLVTGLINAVASQVGPLVDAGLNLIISLINGMANAIDQNGPMLLAAFGNLMASIIGFLGEALAQLASLIPGVGDNIAAMVRSGTESIKGVLSSGDLATAGANAANSIVEGASSVEGEMTSEGQALAENMVGGVESTEGEANSAGQNLSMETISGLISNLPTAESAGGDLGESANTGFESADFFSAGSNGGAGLVEGLISQLGNAQSAGASLGSAAASGAQSALDEHSPSKVFNRIGRFAGEGFCIGMEKTFSEVGNVSENMGYKSINAISNALGSIADYIDSDVTYSPVISPVVDLSNVKNAGGEINRFLGARLPVNLGRNASFDINAANISELIEVNYKILSAIQNGSDLYFDDGAFAGRINRRLGIRI